MIEKIKEASGMLLGGVIFIAILFIPVLFIWGGIKLGTVLIPWLYLASGIAFLVNIVIFLPMAIFRNTREWAGVCMFFSSYVFGLTLWFLGLLLTYIIWGGFAVFIGLFLAGVGVVPVAMLATLFKGLWGPFGILIGLTILTFGTRIFGQSLSE